MQDPTSLENRTAASKHENWAAMNEVIDHVFRSVGAHRNPRRAP